MDGTTTITTVDNADVMQAVRESAMLADVTISMWSAERSDRNAMEKLKSDAGAVGNIGKVVKNMLAGADSKLKETRSAFMAVRALHYSMTLPWVSDPHATRQAGPRLLPHMLFDRYLGAMSKQKRAAFALLDEFLADYPKFVMHARGNLGSLADAEYPSEDEVRRQFRVFFDFEPLPAGVQFKGLPDNTIERLAKALQTKQQRMLDQATKAMWGEAKERVGHIVERLSDPETRFKKSTIENVRELLTLLPGWNLAKNSEVNGIVAGIREMLDGVDVKDIRDNPNVRNDVADKARALVERMEQWGV